MTTSDLRSEIIRLGPWHHDIEVAPGVWTGEVSASATYPEELGKPTIFPVNVGWTRLIEELFPEGMAGRSMLDCACNGGGYLFAATALGAGRCFGFDVREHWIEQARFVQKHVPSDNIEFAVCDLADLPGRGMAPFDVTLFSGLFYHLPDPVAGLRIAADLTKELLVLNTAMSNDRRGHALKLSLESEQEVMSGVHRLAWMPTSEHVLREILKWCGFPHARLYFDWTGIHGRRMQLLAARDERTFAHLDKVHPERRSRWPRLRWPWRR
ncbi:MAG TPA: methyltransferase domain-containing protein [Thermoanaerobaculia bacterium]|jgi:SAM-dependent methyltransferase